jgi:hypothetical protein
MGAILILCGLLALLAYGNVVIVRSLRRRRAGTSWWAALIIAWAVGAAMGGYGGFFFEYRPLPDLRVFGAPIPAAFFHREGPPGQEAWIDFVTPVPILFAGSNVGILGLLAAFPIGMMSWLVNRRPSAGKKALSHDQDPEC